MMELIRQWLLGMACAAMAAALAQSLAPEGGPKRICRLAGALVLLLAAVSPLLKLDEGVLSRLAEDYQVTMGGYTDALEEENNLLYQSIIERQTAAYIVDKAEELGISCQAEVKYRYDQDGAPYPYEARLRGTWTQEQREGLEEMLEEDLDIPPERQLFERTQE
ncbi:MAG TPA: stage III sporulation protein AF [Candidatus Enterenecus stercoripullorum]|nr:stage III sporulation protein AF [Candidatus Enterenecus stercoripullorum]